MKEIGYALLAVLLMAGCGLDSREEKAPSEKTQKKGNLEPDRSPSFPVSSPT